MNNLYDIDNQHVTRRAFLKGRKWAILGGKVRLTCVVSVVLLRGKTYAFTKKCTTLTNQPKNRCRFPDVLNDFNT